MKQTVVLKVNPKKPEVEKIEQAAEVIRAGGLVAFPTETVYGLGADALNADAVLSLFFAKGRPLDNPSIVHIENVRDVYRLVKSVPPVAEKLMRKFWPGPLTLVFKRSSLVPDVTAANLGTVAIRMPDHKVALALIKQSGVPIAAPSANLSGKPSPTLAEHVIEDLDGRIDVVLDGGPVSIGVESTVLDVSVDPPLLLRPGGVALEALKRVVDSVEVHSFVLAESELSVEGACSPGMRHKHYAPVAPLVLVEGSVLAVSGKVRELAEKYEQEGKKVGVLATDETADYYCVDVVKSLGSRRDLRCVALNLFSLLRAFDGEKVDVIIAEGVGCEGVGLAVMNRLRKAANYCIVRAE
jgi:L-threonylcarbamoyladenylate synthase